MIEWNTIVIILCLAMLVFLCWKEWSRNNKNMLVLRLIASIMLIASLYFLAIPVFYTNKIEQKENNLVLLTEGYEKDSLRNFLAREKMEVYDLNDTRLDEILQDHPGINTIHILGYGLEKYQLDKLSGQHLIFHPSGQVKGFTSLQYKKELVQGEPLIVQGYFQNPPPSRVTVMLMDFDTILDSASVDHGKAFTLNYIPSHLGKASYSVLAIAGKDTLEKQRLPLFVNEPEPLKVLFLNSAPGFESRFIKEWLSSKGYQVITRTRVGKNAVSKEFLNEDRSSVDKISSNILNGIDCIVTDNGALSALAGSELAVIKQYIFDKGLGLLVDLDGEESRRALAVKFQMNKSAGGVQQKLALQLSDGKMLQSLNTESQYTLSVSPDVLPLVRDQQGKIYAVVARHGEGHIVLNTVNYSYKWMLSGMRKDYDAFWQALMSRTLGRKLLENWKLKEEWPIVDEPLTLVTETEKAEPVGIVNGQQVALRNNWRLPTEWEGRYWPRKAGWQSVLKSDGSSSWFYVFERSDWKALRLQNRVLQTTRFINSLNNRADKARSKEVEEEKQVPPIIFLVLFMISAGFLWYEQKRMSG